MEHPRHLEIFLERSNQALFGEDAHGLPICPHSREDEAICRHDVRWFLDLKLHARMGVDNQEG